MNKTRGFTLIELIIAVAIIGILSSLAVPSFQEMLTNMNLRSTAESVSQGLQLARSEAIKRNARTMFTFSSTSKWEVCTGASATPATETCCGMPGGARNSDGTCPTGYSVQVKHSAESGKVAIITATLADATNLAAAPNAFSASSTFTGMGRQYADPTTSTFVNPAVGVYASSSQLRTVNFRAAATPKTYQVVITSSGSIKLCDPSAAVGDAKACP